MSAIINPDGSISVEAPTPVVLQQSASVINAGPWIRIPDKHQTYQVTANGSSGAFSVIVVIEVSNDGVNPLTQPLGSIVLSGTAPTMQSDGFATGPAPWVWARARITAISGTGASVTTVMGS